MQEELFGPALAVVLCDGAERLPRVLARLPGSLTVTLWGAEDDDALSRAAAAAAMRKAGRVLFRGVPTGVAVTRAQQHGGPWPASTRPDTTSVGLHAVRRFQRPVALQDAPPWLISRHLNQETNR